MISNIIATLARSSSSNYACVISGHYDSCVSNVLNTLKDVPGINNDASSVAVVMELAQVMAAATYAPETMILFVAVC